tara:strand:+ start:306 stop:878 length:573 start_codon:yes stop_codon:yes gene_type:complete
MAIDTQSITDFKSNYTPAPINRFLATVTRCNSLSSGISRELIFRCESAELPGRTHLTSDSRLYGPIRKIPYNSGFVESTLTFMCSNNYIEEKRFFDQWQDVIQDPDNFDVSYYDSLVGNVKVEVLDEQDKELYQIELLEAFPQNVGAISLGWASNTDYMKFSVTFSYRKWRRNMDIEDVTDRQRRIFSGR